MRNIIYQSDERGCALACLRMLLLELKKDRRYRHIMMDKKGPYSLFDLKEAAFDEGVEITWKEANAKSDLSSNDKWPLLLVVENDGRLHMVLAKQSKKGKLLIYDPEKGEEYIDSEDFIPTWTGKFGEAKVIDVNKGTLKMAKSPFSFRDYFWPGLLATLGGVFMALGFFFIKDEAEGFNSYIFPLVFFALFALCFLVKRSLMLAALRRLDGQYLDRIYHSDQEIFKRHYERYYSFKKTNYPDILNFYEAALSVFALIVLFGLNDPFFLVGAVILLGFSLLSTFVFSRLYKKQMNDIATKESNLFSLKMNEVEKRQAIARLNEASYSVGGKINAIQLLSILSVLVISVLQLVFTQQVSLNFFLFNFFSYLALLDCYKNLLSFFENRRKRESDLLYFAEHFMDNQENRAIRLIKEGRKD